MMKTIQLITYTHLVHVSLSTLKIQFMTKESTCKEK